MAAYRIPHLQQTLNTGDPEVSAFITATPECPTPTPCECPILTSCDCPALTPCICDVVPPAHTQDGCDMDYFTPPGSNMSYLSWIQAWARGVALNNLPETWALWVCSNVSREGYLSIIQLFLT